MRRLLFVATFLVAFFSTFTGGNTVQAQSMALEYAYDAYEKTADGYNSIWIPCDICGAFFGGPTESEAKRAIENHKDIDHPKGWDDSTPGTGGSNGGNSGNSGSGNSSGGSGGTGNYANTVSLYDVASALEHIGVCGSNWFVDEFNTYYRVVGLDGNMVPVSLINNFIVSRLRPITGYSYQRAKASGRPYLMLVRQSSGIYRTVTNRSSGSYTTSRYLYVF